MVRPLRDIVKEARGARRLKQQDLAARLGLKPSKLSDILHGRRPPPIEDADRWCRELALTPAECEEMRDAMALQLADPRVLAIVKRFARDSAELAEIKARMRRALEQLTDDRPRAGGS